MKIEVGNKEAAVRAQQENGANMAAVLREMEFLRAVADTAIRLRSAGLACDQIDEAMQELWRDNPHITKSATQAAAARQAFNTAMKNFDEAVLSAVEAGMSWAYKSKLGPRVIAGQESKDA